MTFAPVGSSVQTTSSSLSVSPSGIGDMMLIAVVVKSATACTGVSGGGVTTWVQLGTTYTGPRSNFTIGFFAGAVTSTGAATATLAFNGSTAAGIRCVGHEYSSTAGGWALDVQGNQDPASTANSMPSLTPAGSGELYFGYELDTGTATAGGTSGYTYFTDSNGNGLCYDAACTSSAQSPVFGDTGVSFASAILVKESASGATAVQAAASSAGALSATFGAGVTAGNSIIIAAAMKTTTAGEFLATTSPLLGGSAFTGAVKLTRAQSPGGTSSCVDWWLLPNIPGGMAGATTVALTGTSSNSTGTALGLLAWEVNGLGSAPVFDRRVAKSGTGGGTATSGTSLAAGGAAGIAIGAAAVPTGSLAGASSPWTVQTVTGGALTGGWQTSVSNSTFTHSAGTATGDWASGVLIVSASVASATGWRDFIPTSGGTASGIDTWTISTPINGYYANDVNSNPLSVQVLPPTSPSSAYAHSILIMIDPGGFPAPLATLMQSPGYHNKYNTTVVAPAFALLPQLANNSIDPTVQLETYVTQLAAWAVAQYGTGGEKVYLLGFSKTSRGGAYLLFRNPSVFAKAAGWDAPYGLSDLAGDDLGGNSHPDQPVQNWGTDYNFQTNYQLDTTNITAWRNASNFAVKNRIWVGGYNTYGTDVLWFDALLTTLGVRHTGWYVSEATHDWHADYIAAAVAYLLGAEPTALPGAGII